MYRTKIYNILQNEFLKPIMDFVGICRSDDSGCGLLKIVGADKRDKKGKVVPTYFMNKTQEKIYAIINSQDEFINYRSRKEELEYFNPFVKSKNTLLLMLMTTPVIYEKVTSGVDDDEDDISSIICDDELTVTQEDILKRVQILQYPSEKTEDDKLLYTYAIKISESDDSIIELKSSSTNQIIAMIMLILKVMSYFDEPLEVVDKFEGSLDNVQVYLDELLIKYEKERTLNSKDIKKIKIETKVEVYNSEDFDMFENNEHYDEIDMCGKEDNEPKHKKMKDSSTDPQDMSINLTDKFKDSIPITYNETDDDILDLEYY